MIKAIGVDIIKIERIERAVSRWSGRFVNRVFTPAEITYCREHDREMVHFAGKFAAKEAVKKAVGGNLNWTDIEIINHEDGKPYLRMKKSAGSGNMLVTISHSDEYAVAFVTVEEG